ncbi:hypothetical protein [Streptomyces sp. CBMA152]|uniref:DUF6197 family protein n=1 Tax=Streptomyces sp. CBMA152 TaxID=1896312 RepID=UPI001660E4D6|nr:hypothetical protein [Streptomyces sp. CBMA152]MBD0743565.1 hypothetical protein [Streptomyces sp. CBMA152]
MITVAETGTKSSPAVAPGDLSLDARMALTLAEMDGRCRIAVLAVDINSAHIATEAPAVGAAPPALPVPCPSPYSTPIAALLHRARIRIETDGWCRDALYDDSGAICPEHAIRLEAASRQQGYDASVLLLESIRRHWQAETIPSWNAQQTSVAPVLLAFDRAAELAHNRSI